MNQRFYLNVSNKGSKVFHTYVDEYGVQRKEVVEHRPELYIKSNRATDVKSMHGEYLESVVFSDNSEMRKFLESYKDIDGFSIYGTENIQNQFVTNNYPGNNIYYDASLINTAIVDIEVFSGDIDADGNVIDGPFPDPANANYPINLITSYLTRDNTFYVFGLEKFKGHHLGTYKHDETHPRVGGLNVVYKGFDDEFTLLQEFLIHWQESQLVAWSGWYIEGFDNPYLTNRIERVCGESAKKRLSPWGIVSKNSLTTGWGEEQTIYDFMGCQMLDYKQLFEKHAFMNPDNMKLDTVAQLILGEGKVDYKDEGNLNTLYVTNYQKAVEYNIVDVNLIVMINRKKRFLELTYTLAYMCKSNYQDTLGTVKPWSALTYSMLCDKGQRPRLKSVYQGDVQFGGGFVREIKGGRYRWVVSCDLNSLYPHIIQQFNMGPETIIEPEDLPADVRNLCDFTLDDLVNKRVDLSILKKYDICMTANRAFFKRGVKSIFNEKTRDVYNTRKGVKSQMLTFEQELVNLESLVEKEGEKPDWTKRIEELEIAIATFDAKQHSLKILMNSLFGALGNVYFREYFDIRVAEGITLSGKLAVLWIARKLDEYFNKVLGFEVPKYTVHHTNRPAQTTVDVVGGYNFAFYQDTDSCYLDMSPLIDKMFTKDQQENEVEKIVEFLDKLFKQKIEPFINKSYEELADYMNADDQRMFMKREVIAPAAIWTAKKRYTMLVANSEGVNYMPKMYHKTIGLDAVKASAPKHCREWMLEGYKLAMTGTESQMQDFVAEKKKQFYGLAVEKIATPTSVNGIEKYLSGGSDLFIKGAPKHVKAAIHHNSMLDKLKISGRSKIKSGDKILYVELRSPNPIGAEVIGFQGKLPEEFNLGKYINYESNFEKSFISPMNNLLGAVNWSAVRQASVLDWFA